MAITKKATTNTSSVKTEEKAVTEPEKKETVTKKAPAKKPVPKKVAPKKPVAKKVAPSKPVVTEPAKANVNFYVEYAGTQVLTEEVIKNVKATYGKDVKNIDIYLKPEESKAYFVADGVEGKMDVFFS